jgi:hypothetical protein
LQFPNFETKAVIGHNDLYLDALPLCDTLDPGVQNSSVHCPSSICHNITAFQESITQETDRLDTLLLSLSQYYETIKTIRQLQFETPADFRQISDHQRDYQSYLRLHKLNQSNYTKLEPSASDTSEDSSTLETFLPTQLSSTSPHSDPVPEQEIDPGNTKSSQQPVLIPTIRSVDKPSSSISNTITVSEDFLRASMGFCRIDTVKRHFHDLYKETMKLDNTPADAILDPGDLATLHKKARNTTPTPRSAHFGDVMNMDIVFRTLFLVQRLLLVMFTLA